MIKLKNIILNEMIRPIYRGTIKELEPLPATSQFPSHDELGPNRWKMDLILYDFGNRELVYIKRIVALNYWMFTGKTIDTPINIEHSDITSANRAHAILYPKSAIKSGVKPEHIQQWRSTAKFPDETNFSA